MGRYEQKLKAQRAKRRKYNRRKCTTCAYNCPFYPGVTSCSNWKSKKSQNKEKSQEKSLFNFFKKRK